jgi:Lar family restriction alleviation protein
VNLKPCPFCGGEAEVEREGTSRQSCIIACADCGCRLESNERGAGEEWNRRAPFPEPGEAVTKPISSPPKTATCGDCTKHVPLSAPHCPRGRTLPTDSICAPEWFEAKLDADLSRFVEAGTKAWADVPDASDWVEEQRGNKPERCGECGIRGPACYPRVATDKACADARQEPSAAPGTTKEADPGQDHFRGSTGAAMPRQTKDNQ